MDVVPANFVPFDRTSPFLDLVGPLYMRNSGGVLTLGLVLETRHCNRRGTAHGGLLVTLADIVLGYTAGHSPGQGRQLTTAALTIEFLGAAKVGEWIEGNAEILKIGQRIANASCLLTVADRKVLHASGVFSVL